MPENVENLKRRMGGGVKRTRGEGRMGGWEESVLHLILVGLADYLYIEDIINKQDIC